MSSRIVGLCIVAAALAGCKAQVPAGPVVNVTPQSGWERGPALGLAVPRVQFTSQDGKTRWLRGNTEWITIMAFVQGSEDECQLLVPSLVQTAGQYHDKPVRVVQVAVPEAKMPRCQNCMEVAHVQEMRLLALCDGRHQAYEAFGKPADGTALLIGGDGKVLAIGNVRHIDELYPQVDRLARNLEQKQMPAYMQMYLEYPPDSNP
jgi:hypothetical protein